MKRSHYAAIVVVLGLLLVAVGLILDREPEPAPVKVGYLPLTANVPLFVALENNYFADEGIAVNPTEFQSSNAMIEALISGRIDVETGASSSVVVAMASRLDSMEQAIFMVNAFTPDDYISSVVVRPADSSRSLSEIASGRVGTFPGSTMRAYTKLFLQKQGIKPEAILELAPQNQLPALQAGSVDALITLEPFGTIAEFTGSGHRILSAPIEKNVLNPWIAGTHSLNIKFARNHPQKANAVRRALLEAVEDIQANPTKARYSIVDYTPVSDSAIAKRLPLPRYLTLTNIDTTAFQRMADLQFEEGLIDSRVDITPLMHVPK